MAKKVTTTNATNAQTAKDEQYLEEMGNQFFELLTFNVPDLDSIASDTVRPDAEASSFSKAILQKLALVITDHNILISDLEEKAEGWKKAGRAKITQAQDEFLEWAERLIPEIGLEFLSGSDVIKLASAKSAVRQTAEAWLMNLAKLSNRALRGEKALEGKSPKLSMFDDEKRGKKLGGFTITSTELVKGKASINFCAEDSDGNIRAAILEIAAAADCFNQNRRAEAAEIILRLTNKSLDKRFGFERDTTMALVQGRLFGLLASAADVMRKQVEEKKEKYLQSIAIGALEQQKLDDMIARLKGQKEYDREHNGIGGTRAPSPYDPRVNPSANSNNQDVTPMQGVTYRSKVEKMALKMGVLIELGENGTAEIAQMLEKGELPIDGLQEAIERYVNPIEDEDQVGEETEQ